MRPAPSIPRRTLAFLTAIVLALHWLVLQGMVRAWEPAPPRASAAGVFSTRTVAPPPLPPAAAPLPAAPVAQAAAAPPPAPPAVRARSRPTPPAEPAAPATAAEAPAPPAFGGTAGATADDYLASAGEPLEAAQATAPLDSAATLPPELAAPAEPSAPTASAAVAGASAPVAGASAAAEPAPAPVTTAAPLQIAPPGAAADPAPGMAAAAQPPPPVRLPPPMRLAFDVQGQAKKFTYSARAELLWQHDGSRYEARQEVGAFLMGSRSQRSTGSITAQGLQPQRFGDKSRSERAAHFDHARGRVTFSANTPEAPVGPGAQDRLSVFIQLGALLAADPARFVPGTQITLTTVSARGADRWTFTVEGPETLELHAGPTPTLKLQRLPRKDYDQKAELWVAPALGYLPVRIQLTQANGDFADLRLSGSSAP